MNHWIADDVLDRYGGISIFLEHHGTKGMKWGVRAKSAARGTARVSGRAIKAAGRGAVKTGKFSAEKWRNMTPEQRHMAKKVMAGAAVVGVLLSAYAGMSIGGSSPSGSPLPIGSRGRTGSWSSMSNEEVNDDSGNGK